MYQFGSGALWARFDDGSYLEFGTQQEVSLDFSFDKKELYGRNQFPVKIARAKGKVDGKAKYANITAEALNLVLNGNITNGELKVAEPLNVTVPNNGEVVIDLPTGSALNNVLTVYNVDGETKVPMKEVDTTPTVSGTYFVDDGAAAVAGSRTYTLTTNFAASDTVVVEGQTFTAVASSPSTGEFEVGSTIADSITNLVALINATPAINTKFTKPSCDSINPLFLTQLFKRVYVRPAYIPILISHIFGRANPMIEIIVSNNNIYTHRLSAPNQRYLVWCCSKN